MSLALKVIALNLFEKRHYLNLLFISAQDAATAPLSETTIEKLRLTLDSKIWGALHVVKHSVPQMPADGSITFISGLAGRVDRSLDKASQGRTLCNHE